MGILWRLFAPKPLKKARRALHPSWVIEDAIVRGVRQGQRKRAAPAPYWSGSTPAGGKCPHRHKTPEAAAKCTQRGGRP